ncbi:uncharacterized protein [Lepeophtheirus salmonis]|uniref:uncharacterized protein n=1 Tax=Lepeophtheirus salmonis TaxID=72036 RepID=UPI001AEB7416|nr:uncharacterized protein LOC121126577 [Lepeophtheirus salmonis]XP_040577801.1 uncharacterized protein LOC121126577 [Lepeophtheirus salmonis]XP_040577802.1 uncharacterized protein LOC121126577 [Lepeophtheirus salmonis]
MDLHFKFSPPVQLLFHEQAKSIVALQELQSEVNSLLEFKNILLETYPNLQSKVNKRPSSNIVVNNPINRIKSVNEKNLHLVQENCESNKEISSEFIINNELTQSWNYDGVRKSSAISKDTKVSECCPIHFHNNVSDSGFGNSHDLKDSTSMNLLLQNISAHGQQIFHDERISSDQHFLVDEVIDDELFLLLDVIHKKTVKMTNMQDARVCMDQLSELNKCEKIHQQEYKANINHHDLTSLQSHYLSKSNGLVSNPSESIKNKILSSNHASVDVCNQASKKKKTLCQLQDQYSVNKCNSGDLSNYVMNEIQSHCNNYAKVPSKMSSCKKEERKKVNDIIHSVQIRTSSSSVDQSNKPSSINDNSINIEIKRVPSCNSRKKMNRENSIKIDYCSSSNEMLTSAAECSKSSSPKCSFEKLKKQSLPESCCKKLPFHINGINTFSESSHTRKLSELSMSKIGKTDKLELGDICSLPAIVLISDNKFLAQSSLKKSNLSTKITREKIRKVLKINNVIELQRQLLTTVMEKEVYKTHLEKLCDIWAKKLKEFELQNESLQTSLSNLKLENECLRSQV